MASLFTEMIEGSRHGEFVWRDDRVAAVMALAPVKPGHVIVFPCEPIDHWIDVDPELMQHLTNVAQQVGRAIQSAMSPQKVGLSILGLQVRHTHLHVVPMETAEDLTLSNGDANARPEDIASAADLIRAALRAQGCAVEAGLG